LTPSSRIISSWLSGRKLGARRANSPFPTKHCRHGNREFTRRPRISSRERIRPNLEMRDLALCAFAAFDVPDEMSAVVGPQSAAFPSGVGIVDAAIHTA